MKKFAVFGNPIKHSKSPIIHEAFAAQCNIELTYEKRLVSEKHFEDEVTLFFEKGGAGLNITLPFKERAFNLAAKTTERAQLARAANTLYTVNNQVVADNTDGEGLVRDITINGYLLKNKRVLILGAGGACRGAIPSLLNAGVKELIIANRTEQKALAIVEEVSNNKLKSLSYNQLNQVGIVDIVINSTSSSVTGEVPGIPFSIMNGVELAYDMFYSNKKTAFELAALKGGAKNSLDGKGMLIEQAAESFRIWHNEIPDTKSIRAII
jgi:shikimate dehydrogenase